MNRRNYLFTSGMAVGAVSLPGKVAASENKGPNLLFIFPDQMRREAMGFWQKGKFKGALNTVSDPVITPALDKLAQESVVFTQAVSTCPVCSPHRAMLMSGMWPWQNGVVNNCHQNRPDSLKHDIDCFTDVLAQSGYDTCYVGKTHWERNDPLFDENQNYVGTAEAPGGHHFNPYDTYIPPGRGRHGVDYWFQCVKDVHKDPRVYSNRPERIDGKADGVQHRPEIYSPKLEADVLVDYLKNNIGQRDASKPFSIIWAPNPPHNPYASEKDCDEIAYREFYKDKHSDELLIRPNVVESDAENLAKAKKSVPFYFANITGVDKQLGRVFQALEQSGEADNTIVVFTADHGEMMGSHNKFGKLVIYEEAFCVPFMIKYPGKTKGTLEDLMITPVDIMPTVLGMLGLKKRIPSTVEGKNFSREIISGDWSATDKPKSAHFLGINKEVKGLRTDRYSFQIDKEGKQILFDNETDPYQMKELQLADISQADADFIVSELGMWLKQSNDPWYRKRKLSELINYPA
ncbi:sulfatase family protein [Pontiella sulfatireligans]|uniref:Arylsulfatase n=1 Tax=Pontiella sulfatireligans TaxID=2750658 RepID=A0A6C2UFJ9_9BACT|nr:sulfatase [Pontiella sulfatireligans]SPS74139.1 sulfatase S1_27 [Kiritimatiellales bacterium]VGO18164.1 Arylsulfatase [Pontiella sulfatireligans]